MTAAVEKETPPPASLTPRQRDVYEWIVEHCETLGYSPTVREVAKGVGVNSPNCITGHLGKLRAKGWISWTPGRSRTLRPIGGVR